MKVTKTAPKVFQNAPNGITKAIQYDSDSEYLQFVIM